MLGTVRGIQALGQEARDTIGCADRVFLHEVMQHVDKPLDLLVEVHDLLVPHGLAFVMFTPWGSPYGANTADLLPVPWLHLLYPKSVWPRCALARAAGTARIWGPPACTNATLGNFSRS